MIIPIYPIVFKRRYVILSYEEFKTAVRTDLKKYMPDSYANHKLVETKLYKINRCVDSFHLQPPGPIREAVPMPSLNFQDLYQSIVGGAKLENVMRLIAQTMQYTLPASVERDCSWFEEDRKPDPSRLHVALINRYRNEEYLKNIPHHGEGSTFGAVCPQDRNASPRRSLPAGNRKGPALCRARFAILF